MVDIIHLRCSKQRLPLRLTLRAPDPEGILFLDMIRLVLLTQANLFATLREHFCTQCGILRNLVQRCADARLMFGHLLAVVVDPKWTQNGLDWPLRVRNASSNHTPVFWARESHWNCSSRVYFASLGETFAKSFQDRFHGRVRAVRRAARCSQPFPGSCSFPRPVHLTGPGRWPIAQPWRFRAYVA